MKVMRYSVFIILMLLVLGSFAGGQIVTEKPVQTNSFTQHEVGIAIDLVDNDRLMVVWNDFEFSPYRPGYGVSSDGGDTWASGVIVPNNYHQFGFDPSVSYNTLGVAFYCYVGSTGEFKGPVYVSRTSNQGATWYHRNTGSGNGSDKPYLAVDNGSNEDTRGNIYIVWKKALEGIQFARSTDGGITFDSYQRLDEGFMGQTVTLSPTDSDKPSSGVKWTQGPVPAVDPRNGHVYVVWLEADGSTGSSGRIKLRKSDDTGTSWGPTHTILDGFTVAGKEEIGSIRNSNLPTIVVDPISGDIYVAAIDWNGGISM